MELRRLLVRFCQRLLELQSVRRGGGFALQIRHLRFKILTGFIQADFQQIVLLLQIRNLLLRLGQFPRIHGRRLGRQSLL